MAINLEEIVRVIIAIGTVGVYLYLVIRGTPVDDHFVRVLLMIIALYFPVDRIATTVTRYIVQRKENGKNATVNR